jgi:hypothetical protein
MSVHDFKQDTTVLLEPLVKDRFLCAFVHFVLPSELVAGSGHFLTAHGVKIDHPINRSWRIRDCSTG